MRLDIYCDECEATFTLVHALDDNFYKSTYCPFCGEEVEDIDTNDHLEDGE